MSGEIQTKLHQRAIAEFTDKLAATCEAHEVNWQDFDGLSAVAQPTDRPDGLHYLELAVPHNNVRAKRAGRAFLTVFNFSVGQTDHANFPVAVETHEAEGQDILQGYVSTRGFAMVQQVIPNTVALHAEA